MSRKRPKNYGRVQERMAARLDELAAFEEYKENVLPALRRDVEAGLSAEELYKKYQAVAAARTISLAFHPDSPQVVLAAARDILDRSGGKAVERREVKHKYEELTDEQLDQLLEDQLKALDEPAPKASH